MSEDDNIINDDFFEILRLNKIEVVKEEPSTATLTAKADRKKVHNLIVASKVKSSSAVAAGAKEKPVPSSNTASAAASGKKKSAGRKEKAAIEEGAKKTCGSC